MVTLRLFSSSCYLPSFLFLFFSPSGIKGWLSWSASPLGGAVCWMCAQFPAFVPDSLEVVVGFLVFFSLVHNLPQLPMQAVIFLVPYGFFVFCCWRRGVSRCKHCSTAAKGPNPQPVPWPHSLPQDLNLSLVWWVPSAKVSASSLDIFSLNPGGGSCFFYFLFLCSLVSSLSPFS